MPAKEIVRVDVVGRDKTGKGFASAKRKADNFQDSITRLNAKISGLPIVQAAQSIRGLGAAFAVAGVAAVAFGRHMYNVLKRYDSYNFTLKAVTGSQQAASKEMEFLVATAQKYGVSVDALAKDYGRLYAATSSLGLTLAETQELYEGIAAASAVYNLSAADTSLVVSALTQIANKGVVSMEELRRQLGERLPGALQVAARAMHMTTQELIDTVSGGGLASLEFLRALGPQFTKEFADSAADAASRLQGQVNNLVTAWDQYLVQVNNVLQITDKTGATVGIAATALQFWADSWEVLGDLLPNVGEGINYANEATNKLMRDVEGAKMDLQDLIARFTDLIHIEKLLREEQARQDSARIVAGLRERLTFEERVTKAIMEQSDALKGRNDEINLWERVQEVALLAHNYDLAAVAAKKLEAAEKKLQEGSSPRDAGSAVIVGLTAQYTALAQVRALMGQYIDDQEALNALKVREAGILASIERLTTLNVEVTKTHADERLDSLQAIVDAQASVNQRLQDEALTQEQINVLLKEKAKLANDYADATDRGQARVTTGGIVGAIDRDAEARIELIQSKKFLSGLDEGTREYEVGAKYVRELEESIKGVEEAVPGIMDGFADNLRNNLARAITSGNFDDIGNAFVAALQASLLESVLDTAFEAFGKTAIGSALGFAEGGHPAVGVPRIVGEKGPELEIPRYPTTIIPNHALGGIGNVDLRQNINIEGLSRDEAFAVADRMAMQTKAELMDLMNRGRVRTYN